MKLIFELSKEHESIPSAEVLACLQAEDTRFSIIKKDDEALIINIDDDDQGLIDKLASRLSFTYFISELLFVSSTDIEEIKNQALSNPLPYQGSVAVRWRNRSRSIESQDVISTITSVYTKGRIVDLEKPMIEIKVLITDNNIYTGIVKGRVNRSQFEDRRVQYRPFFSPITLHPKIARSIVNLSCIKPGERLLDPFCGTGGILLEAGLIGAHAIGSDIQEKMIIGCRKTLDYYHITDYELYCVDVGDTPRCVGCVDAVVTDLPYGKATTTRGEKTDKLYERAFQSISKTLKKNKRAVVGAPDESVLDIGGSYLSYIETHRFCVHRSLTRYFTVYKK